MGRMATTTTARAMLVAVAAAVVACVAAHSSLVIPPSRNAVDRVLPPWKNGKYGTDGWGCNCVNTSVPCDVAQSCFWFSQGCTIGCKTCDGGPSNPNTVDRCGSGMKPTVNNPLHRTFNRNATAGSAEDIYKHNPWRAAGSAPVYDPCGMAGGGPKEEPGEAKYTTTVFAKQGDLGSKVLPPAPSGTVWKAGDVVETAWSIRANHGGGYQYRLCPSNETLTEECFQARPIPFAEKMALRWENGTQQMIPGTYVMDGVLPVGSTWAMNPLPYSNSASPPEFDPPCHETVDRLHNDTGKCSGRDPYDVLIIDWLIVPATTAPGDYVLGLRWDCEKSAQIWSACADITIV